MASVEPHATSFKDCLPDENAYWYWVRLLTADKKIQEIGPVRVDIDKNGSAHYVKAEDKYQVSITRTDELSTLKWDFPEGEYKIINAVRFSRLVTEYKGKEKGETVLSTLERKSQCTDALPDANSDYWYWFRITMKSGSVIYKGPIKAEYAGQ